MSRFSLPTKSFALLACLALLLAAIGCQLGKVTAPVPAPDGAVLSPNFVRVLSTSKGEPGLAMSASSSGVISASLGGSLSNGRITLEFLPGALNQDTEVTIIVEDPNLLLCDLRPEGIHFNVPVILKFNLLGTTHEGRAAETVTVWYNSISGYWEPLPQLPVLDPNETRATLEHFSQYAKIGG